MVRAAAPPVHWSDPVDAILGGDQTAALLLTTPARGAVAVPVSPIGLRNRDAGTVSITSSRSFGRKLEHIARDPRVGLCFHTREHGLGGDDGFVIVQGRARVAPLEGDRRAEALRASERFEGPLPTGRFWDRWLAAYVDDRVEVVIEATRVTCWPTTDAQGEPTVIGAPLAGPPPAQAEPANGTGPRVSLRKVARAVERMPHRLLAWTGDDGYPTALPFDLLSVEPGGLLLDAPAGLPTGSRRAGLLAHRYNAQMIGLAQQVCTGWLTVDSDCVRYAPHTSTGFSAPANKTLLLLVNGFLATRMQKRVRPGCQLGPPAKARRCSSVSSIHVACPAASISPDSE
jgi:hypothetical protein